MHRVQSNGSLYSRLAAEAVAARMLGTSRRGEPTVQLTPLSFDERSANKLRPATFAEMVGQPTLKAMLRRIVDNCRRSGRPLDHMLMVGESGTGKTTTAQVVANELGRRCFMLKAPVDYPTFEAMTRDCQDGDVVIIDEVHLQQSGDRRGITQSADVETFFSSMEERRLITPTGVVPFPAVTFIGTTTDEGLLSLPFLNRFPLRPHLEPYSYADMAELAVANARQLDITISADAAAMFSRASRLNPRQLNTYARNAVALGHTHVGVAEAREVIVDLNGTDLDGLNPDMKNMLRCLLRSPRVVRGETVYRAGVNTIATQIGKSRDSKSVALYTEPWLIREGYVEVTSSGRQLTAKGILRAQAL
jgi:Holliday junction DNA helicase RuvB